MLLRKQRGLKYENCRETNSLEQQNLQLRKKKFYVGS